MTLSPQAQKYVEYRKHALDLAHQAVAKIDAMPTDEADVERLSKAYVAHMADIKDRLFELVKSFSKFVMRL